MTDIGNPEVVTEDRKEKILRLSAQLADFLIRESPEVKGVGLFGSLSRNSNPHDVDMVLFTTEEVACADLLGNEENAFPYYLNLSVDQEGRLFELLVEFMRVSCPVDVTFLPRKPSVGFLTAFTSLSNDPSFLPNMLSSLQVYDKDRGNFTKGDYYNKEVVGIIKQISTAKKGELQPVVVNTVY